jgi:hypothetical protein
MQSVMRPKFISETTEALGAPKFSWPSATGIQNRVVFSSVQCGVMPLRYMIRADSHGKLKIIRIMRNRNSKGAVNEF